MRLDGWSFPPFRVTGSVAGLKRTKEKFALDGQREMWREVRTKPHVGPLFGGRLPSLRMRPHALRGVTYNDDYISTQRREEASFGVRWVTVGGPRLNPVDSPSVLFIFASITDRYIRLQLVLLQARNHRQKGRSVWVFHVRDCPYQLCAMPRGNQLKA